MIGSSAVLQGTLSDNRVDRVGFVLREGETETILEGKLEGNSFTATATGLELDKTYHWEAFAKAGSSEIRSSEQSLTAPNGVIPIPDNAFKAYLLDYYDVDRDGELSRKEGELVWRIEFCSNELGVKSLKGIEYLENLEELSVNGTWFPEGADLSAYPYYYLSKHYHWDETYGPLGTLEELDVSHNPNLRILRVIYNSALGDLQGTLDLSNNPKLEELEIGMTFLVFPDVSHLKNLTVLNCTHLRGPIPDIKIFPHLRVLDLGYEQTGRVAFLDLSQNPELEHIRVSHTASGLSDLSLNPKLSLFDISDCNFEQIDISPLSKLTTLIAPGNWLRTLDVSNNPDLNEAVLSRNDRLDTLYIAPGQHIPGITENRSTQYIPDRTVVAEKFVPVGAIPIPDLEFKKYLIQNYDWNADGMISSVEAQWITEISLETDQVSSVQGIEYMPHLKRLEVPGSNPGRGRIKELDVSHNQELNYLYCINNQIRSLDVSHNPLLVTLSCWENQLLEYASCAIGFVQCSRYAISVCERLPQTGDCIFV